MLRFHSKVDAAKQKQPRVSVVGEYADGHLIVAVSRCTTKDAFNKKKGNMIAEGRLIKAKKRGEYNTTFTARFKTEDESVKFFLETAETVSNTMAEKKSIITLGEQKPKSVMQKVREFLHI
jgi:hypothetical protein